MKNRRSRTAIAEKLGQQDIGLELLTGPLAGVYDPSGHGAALFAFFAGMAESEHEYIREKSTGTVETRNRQVTFLRYDPPRAPWDAGGRAYRGAGA